MKRRGGIIPNDEDVSVITYELVRTQYSLAQSQLMDIQKRWIDYIAYLEKQRDYKNGCYKYVVTEGDGENAVSTTWYSWCSFPGHRYTATMEGLIQCDLDVDAKWENERLPDEPVRPKCTYYQKNVAHKCRLINYPDDLLPITEEEQNAWANLKKVQDAIAELNEKFGAKNDENSSE